jgi:hypothetical protein
MQKFAMPFHHTGPPLFWLIPPEAFLPGKPMVRAQKKIANQRRVKARQKSGPGVWPAAQKLFSVLIFFGPFLYQDKKGLATAAIEGRMFSVTKKYQVTKTSATAQRLSRSSFLNLTCKSLIANIYFLNIIADFSRLALVGTRNDIFFYTKECYSGISICASNARRTI